jgi:hypothetical protein
MPLRIDCAGWSGRGEADGPMVYDLTGPPSFTVNVDRPGKARGGVPPPPPALSVPETAEAVLRLASDSSEDGTLRGLALRALCARPELLDRLDLPALAADPPEDMAEATVWALSRRPEAITPTVFMTLAGSLQDPAARALLWEAGAAQAFDSPQIAGLVDRSLPDSAPSKADGEGIGHDVSLDDLKDYEEKECRDRILDVVLERYETRRDPALFEVLSRRLDGWVRGEPEGASSFGPADRVLDFAYEGRWTEFEAQFRSLSGSARRSELRKRIEKTLRQFEGQESNDP